MSEYIILFGVPIAVFAVTAFATFQLGKTKKGAALVGIGTLWLAFTVVMFFGMQNASGWDGLGYLLGLLLISAPSGLAALIGSALGWAKNEKAIDA